jgi:hypothetical protein
VTDPNDLDSMAFYLPPPDVLKASAPQERKTTAQQLIEASERFVKPNGDFDARAYLDSLNNPQP